jgi:hypothetical protein
MRTLSRVREKLCLLTKCKNRPTIEEWVVRIVPLLRSRHTNPLFHTPCDLPRFGL